MAPLDETPSSVIALGVVMPCLCTMTVALRFFAPQVRKTKFGVDDWLILPALALVIGMGAALVAGVALKSLAYGTPPPQNPGDPLDSTSKQLTTTSKIEVAVMFSQNIEVGLVKLTFLFFFRRMFCTNVKAMTPFNIVTVVLITLVSSWIAAFLLTALTMCGTNFQALWGTEMDMLTHCANTKTQQIALAVSNFVFDVTIIVLPIPKIWGLRMDSRRKLAVSGAFLLGTVFVLPP